ncbi:Os07g0405700, partial [Oryza sativa Japonica Group]
LLLTLKPKKPREKALCSSGALNLVTGREEEGRQQSSSSRGHLLPSCVPLSTQDAGFIPLSFIPFGAADRRERGPHHRCSGARTECRRRVLVVVPTAVDQAKPSRRANIFSLKSSSKPFKNPRQWRSKCGDRPPSSSPPVAVAIVDSASSVLGAD